MNRQVLKVTNISDFFVCAYPGVKIFDSFVNFGDRVDVSNFSAFLRQRFYDLGLIGSEQQFLKVARKIRPEKSAKLPIEIKSECRDIGDDNGSAETKLGANLKVRKK